MSKEITRAEAAESMGIAKVTLEWRIKNLKGYNFPDPVGLRGRALTYNEDEVMKCHEDSAPLFAKRGRKKGSINKAPVSKRKSFEFSGESALRVGFLSSRSVNQVRR